MSRISAEDGSDSFDVTLLEASAPSRVVLFAVGRGGDPERHLPLLASLVEHGATVVAPHFEMIPPTPSEADLLLRARRLSLALDAARVPAAPVAGMGHSIGATVLLGLAGAQLWTRAGQRVHISPCQRIDRLVLLAPATGFVRAPGALDGVNAQILAWAGTEDRIAPPAGVEFLKEAVGERAVVDVRIVEGGGHFSFMNSPPPQTTEPLADRERFLERLAVDVARFAMAR